MFFALIANIIFPSNDEFEVDNHTYSNVRHVRHNQYQAYKKAYDSYRVCNIKYADPLDAELYCRKEPLLSTYDIE